MKKRQKHCKLCERFKDREEFPMSDRGSGINEYCYECKEKYKHHVLIINEGNFAIDALTKEEADILILHGHVRFKKNRYFATDTDYYLSHIKGQPKPTTPPSDKILSLGKYEEKRNLIPIEVAHQLVQEEAAVWENEYTVRHLFSGKELQYFVVNRDQGICYFCKGKGDRITFHTPRTAHGLLSPYNSICCCQSCKETEGENFFFYKWLNAPILIKKEDQQREDSFVMIEKSRQTRFFISEETAQTLLEEEMAEQMNDNTIVILHDHREFRAFILERDQYICQYCTRYGDTIDHVVPKANGGMTTPKNCICACDSCNEKKGDSDPERFLKKRKHNLLSQRG